jgi:alanine dehydrogenase
MPTLVLDRQAVRELLDMGEVIAAVEQAFRDLGQGRAKLPPKSYVAVPEGDFRAMPAALPGAAGLKWVNVHPGNASRGLPTVMGVMVLNDPATGYPLAVMDATDLTAFRTGATAAIASSYLARREAHSLGIVGAGRQAYSQIEAHRRLFDITAVLVYDLNPESIKKLAAAFPGLTVRESPLDEVAGADIVCTLTPSRKPYLKRAWLRPGTHINAVGADAEGKEELDPAILKAARVVVDDVTQASAAGEINVPLSQGLFPAADIDATLAEVVNGVKPGRQDDTGITVFDATGVAIEDVAVAAVLYKKAMERGGYPMLDLLGF